LKVISEWDKNKTEKYEKDILGSIDYELSELVLKTNERIFISCLLCDYISEYFPNYKD